MILLRTSVELSSLHIPWHCVHGKVHLKENEIIKLYFNSTYRDEYITVGTVKPNIYLWSIIIRNKIVLNLFYIQSAYVGLLKGIFMESKHVKTALIWNNVELVHLFH